MSVHEAQDEQTENPVADDKSAMEISDSEDGAAGSVAIGVDRYVQLGFAGLGLILFWLSLQIIKLVWNYFGEPNTIAVTVGAALVAVSSSYALYRHERTGGIAFDIAEELSKVTWPSREELRGSTIVVIVTSIVASLYTGALDFVWSWLSDFVYKL